VEGVALPFVLDGGHTRLPRQRENDICSTCSLFAHRLLGLPGHELQGAFVGGFEVAFQVAIAGAGVASAVALLYTAPVIVAFLAWPLLRERLTAARVALAVLVMLGAALTVVGPPGRPPAGGGPRGAGGEGAGGGGRRAGAGG
jgi:drug/metabolite transporter (DMT)-like permease